MAIITTNNPHPNTEANQERIKEAVQSSVQFATRALFDAAATRLMLAGLTNKEAVAEVAAYILGALVNHDNDAQVSALDAFTDALISDMSEFEFIPHPEN